jgi:transposase
MQINKKVDAAMFVRHNSFYTQLRWQEPMAQDAKKRQLQEHGTLNRRPGKIKESLFHSNPFFDPHDLAQVKYEMVRQVTHEGKSISEASTAFGMSRPTFYQAQAALEKEGVMGLAPQKTGPKSRHKLTAAVMTFIDEELARNATISSAALAELVQNKFSVTVHQRSIDRALAAEKKMPARKPKR